MRKNLPTGLSVRFYRQLAWLLQSNCSLSEASKTMHEAATESAMTRLLDQLGTPDSEVVSDWLSNAPEAFPSDIVAAIKHAEALGKTPQCLDALASDLFRLDTLEDGGRGILVYPAAIMAIMAVIGVIYSIFVLPSFREVFESFGAQLPAPTQFALSLIDWLIIPLLLITGLVVLTVILSRLGKNNTPMHRLGEELSQQLLAIIGYRQYRSQLVWGRAIKISAVSIRHALNTALMLRAAAANTLDKTEAGLLRQMAVKLDGNDLPTAFLTIPKLPPFIQEMLFIGNKTGRFEDALIMAGTMVNELALNKISVIRQRFEVTISIVVGLFVGFMVIAMYLPIFKLGQTVG